MSDRLNTAMKQLAAEARATTPPAIPSPLLDAEWDRRLNDVPRLSVPVKRAFPWWKAGVAVAATIIAGLFLFPKQSEPEKPKPIRSANVLLPPKTEPLPPAAPVKRPKARHTQPRPTAVDPVLTADAEEPFTPIPFTTPLAPNERADVIRMDLPVSALIAAGLPVRVSDPGARARADLVVGEDGRARAVRLISISNTY
jgi:hypothetical protein